MTTNLDKFKKDLEDLLTKGKDLLDAIQIEHIPEEMKEEYGEEFESMVERLPNFNFEYQSWYSEAKMLIKQLLPDRLDDFIRHYEKPKNRKVISFENYRIEDCLQGLTVSNFDGVKASPASAIPHVTQQYAILDAVNRRFESSLFDIRQLVQADLFDSELLESEELLSKGFKRAAGAIAGVVLEKHLAQVVKNHGLRIRKKNPTINDLNELLKTEGVIDTPPWRQIQRLGDIRNLCDHNKDREPTKEEVKELIDGVERFTKTLF